MEASFQPILWFYFSFSLEFKELENVLYLEFTTMAPGLMLADFNPVLTISSKSLENKTTGCKQRIF
jgi:hypothetical protein